MTGATADRDATREDYKDLAKVKKLFDRAREDAKGNIARQSRDRQDIHNLLLYRGGPDNHWSALNTYTGRYEPIPSDGEDGLPPWIMRCCTNIFANQIDGVTAILNQSVPAKQFVPATDDDEDRATAEVAEDADPVLLDEIGYERLRRRINQLVSLTDKCALVVYYDGDPKYGEEEIELYQCFDCREYMTPMETGGTPADQVGLDDDDFVPGAECPHCGSPNVTIAVDPRTGRVIGVPYPVGKMCGELLSGYEFSLPSTAVVADADENEWFLSHQQLTVDRAAGDWSDYAAQIRAQGGGRNDSALQQQYAEQMRNLSSPGASAGAGSMNDRERVTVYRLLHDPIETEDFSFPRGLHAVMVGDIVVLSRELPLKDARGAYRKNALIRTFADTPCTPYGKPPADDLNPLQLQRNKFEALIYLTLMLHGAPQVFIPEGVEMIDEWTGEPWKPQRYRSTVAGARPTIERGINPAESLYRSVEMIDEAMNKISRLNSVLAGERPAGDPTLGEVQILQEQGMLAFRVPLDHQIDFEKRLSRMLLDLARQTAWAPRFRRVEGEDGRWEVRQFTAADLNGAVDIMVDAMSAWPKSPHVQLMRIQKAAELGAVQIAGDPELATKVLTVLSLTELKPSLDKDRAQVARELDRWKAATSPVEIEPPDLDVIEKPIHLFLKRQFLKSEAVEQLKRGENRPLYDAMVAHVKAIEVAMQPPAPPDPNQAPAGPDGAAIQAAVDAGAIVPAGARPPAPPPDVLGDAVNAGVLLPAAALPPQGPTGPSMDQLLEVGALTPAPRPVAPAGAPPS